MKLTLNLELITEYAVDAGIAIAILAVIVLGLVVIHRLSAGIKRRLQSTKVKSVRIFGLEIVNEGRLRLIISAVMNGLQIVASVVFLYLALVVTLSQVPATETIAQQLIDLIFVPLQSLFSSFVENLPGLFSIVVTIVIARYLIRGVRYVSTRVEKGSLKFPGIRPRTAHMTGGILTFLIYVFSIIIILPNMPGYESLAFRGIAAFLGALVTIGGSSVIANFMAGIVLTYMHAFDVGDWIEVDGVTGKIVASDEFAIRLEAYKGESISIPNSKLLGSAIRNYSGVNRTRMMIHTEVSIGYDVPWKRVNDLLLEAAGRTSFLDPEEQAYVHQTRLDDFYVVYQLNAGLKEPENKLDATSDLHANILDVFAEAGIEIMSPHYRAERDGNQQTVPQNG